MKTDGPFQKSFVCGGVAFGTTLVVLFIANAQNINSYHIGYVFFSWFVSALVVGAWGFFSKKTWAWGRFAATVLGFFLLFSFIQNAGRLQKQTPATISFSQQLTSSWVENKDQKRAANDGASNRSVSLQTSDKKRIIIVQTSALSRTEVNRGIEFVAEEWKRGVLDSARDNFGGGVEGAEFSFHSMSGHKSAKLSFRVVRPDLTLYVFGQSWLQGQTFVAFQAIGQGVEVLNDKEIEDILSSVRISE